jgi:hypothetical protein
VSSALGLASVTVVLADLLRNGIIDHDVPATVGDVKVSALPPDRVLPATGTEDTRLNLFLYQVTPNSGWRNMGLPAIGVRGERVSDPPLALDLHYLLTAYGPEDYYAEILLGYAMQLLHETPVLARADVRKALAPSPVGGGPGLPPALEDLATSGLADQLELIKITPEALSTEEISRLWAAFQTHYRATAAYQASVVLIESDRPTSAPLPVAGYNVYARTLRRPVVESVAATTGAGEPILWNSRIEISGRGLAAESTLVRIDDTLVEPAALDVTPARITLPLAPEGLAAGVHTLQVVHREAMGTPPAPHRGTQSNLVQVLVSPRITDAPSASLHAGSATGLRSGEVTLDVEPAIRPGQRVILLLNQLLPRPMADDAVARSYRFQAGTIAATKSTIDVPVVDVEVGTYLVRIEVDGAQSPVAMDAGGRYASPHLEVAP